MKYQVESKEFIFQDTFWYLPDFSLLRNKKFNFIFSYYQININLHSQKEENICV